MHAPNQNPGAIRLLEALKKSSLQKIPSYIDCEKVARLIGMNDSSKIAEAIDVLNQQQALIGGLQLAHNNAVKVAAALTEAVKLAQDGMIDVSDVIEHTKRSLASGNVKLSSVDELFNLSPGEIVHEAETTQSSGSADVLTQTIRDLRS